LNPLLETIDVPDENKWLDDDNGYAGKDCEVQVPVLSFRLAWLEVTICDCKVNGNKE
jgi:hypothetical protein